MSRTRSWRERASRRVSESERRPWIILTTVLFGLFTVGFTITILAVALKTIAADLDSSEATMTWIITGPMLAMALLGPTLGKLSDLHGARRVYLLGLMGACFFAGLTSIAWSGGSLVAFRVLAAACGAAAGPSSLSLINTSFDRERRVQAMGLWSFVMAGGPVLGVVAGAPVVEFLSWRLIFVAQVPLMVVGLLVAFLVLPETPRRAGVRFDVAGSVLITLTAALFLVGLNRGPEVGWAHPVVVGSFLLAPVAAATWVVVERRVVDPLVPLRYLRRRNFVLPISNQFLTNFAYMGGFILTPALLQDVMGLSVATTGYVTIARPLSFAVAGPVAGWWAMRVGERRNAVLGSAAIVASMLMLASVGPASAVVLVVVALALSGLGMGGNAPAMAATVANSVDDHDLGIAGATQQMASTLGTVAGIQIMFTVQASLASTAGLAPSFSRAYLVGAAACAAGVAAAWFIRSTSRVVVAEGGEPRGEVRGDLSLAAPLRR